jgi:hemolysin III
LTRPAGLRLLWLLAGGILYTVGAVIYATKRPNITFGMVGFHEIFHVFVLGGSLCHYILMLNYLPY